MTGVGQASNQGYLGFRKLVKCQRNIQRWGGEEKPVALRLQTRCLEACEIPQPKTRDHTALIRRLTTLAPSIIVVNDPCLFFVLLIQQPFMCFLCAVHLAVGGTLLIWRWRHLDCRVSSVRNSVRWRDYTGK